MTMRYSRVATWALLQGLQQADTGLTASAVLHAFPEVVPCLLQQQ